MWIAGGVWGTIWLCLSTIAKTIYRKTLTKFAEWWSRQKQRFMEMNRTIEKLRNGISGNKTMLYLSTKSGCFPRHGPVKYHRFLSGNYPLIQLREYEWRLTAGCGEYLIQAFNQIIEYR